MSDGASPLIKSVSLPGPFPFQYHLLLKVGFGNESLAGLLILVEVTGKNMPVHHPTCLAKFISIKEPLNRTKHS